MLYRGDKIRQHPAAPPGTKAPTQTKLSQMVLDAWGSEPAVVKQEYWRRADRLKRAHQRPSPPPGRNTLTRVNGEADETQAAKIERWRGVVHLSNETGGSSSASIGELSSIIGDDDISMVETETPSPCQIQTVNTQPVEDSAFGPVCHLYCSSYQSD